MAQNNTARLNLLRLGVHNVQLLSNNNISIEYKIYL